MIPPSKHYIIIYYDYVTYFSFPQLFISQAFLLIRMYRYALEGVIDKVAGEAGLEGRTGSM